MEVKVAMVVDAVVDVVVKVVMVAPDAQPIGVHKRTPKSKSKLLDH